MKDTLQIWYDKNSGVSIKIVDATSASQALANAHISGPASSYCLSKALAAAVLLGSESPREGESFSIQMKCSGPLGGFNVEYLPFDGTLRGYTDKKILDDFDGLGKYDEEKIIVSPRYQIMRTMQGAILSQANALSYEEYLSSSLQRRASIYLESSVSDEVRFSFLRGVMVELMPDSNLDKIPGFNGNAANSPRNILDCLGFPHAELKESRPVTFACRCSPERVSSVLASLPKEELLSMPPKIDVTCHMCGKIYTIDTLNLGGSVPINPKPN
jgi:molecular chaperone Hsp33